MSVFVTSDTHFRHNNILTLGDGRPFSSIEEHDETIINNWNSVVSDDDIVIHLGDAVMGPREQNLPVIDRLNGRIILVPGNHDTVSSVESASRRERFRPIYERHFDAIWPECVSLGSVVLSHYPPAEIPDHGEVDRFSFMRPRTDEGHNVFVHGHSHQTHTHTPLANGGVAVNVGVDANNWTPVSIDTMPEFTACEREFLWIMALESVNNALAPSGLTG